jgi:RNA polymerase sigma-70 factor (ECF subfamily)
MLGSAHDAEDVLQEVSLRAWRGRDGFDGRASRRTWLHKIATNACLNELDRKERRILPVEFGPMSEQGEPFSEPRGEVPWLEPFPADPEQSAAEREGVELAFVAAVQHLPPNQRAALIMFEVLGFSAQEIAEAMETSVASVNSALQRARKLIDERTPERSQQATLAELGDAGQRRLVERYADALRTADVDGMLALLTEDATWSMPPLRNWYRGHEAIAAFLTVGPFTVDWRHRFTTANGQLAVGAYSWDDEAGDYRAHALDVLELRGDKIAAIVAFLDGSLFPAFGLPPAVER